MRKIIALLVALLLIIGGYFLLTGRSGTRAAFTVPISEEAAERALAKLDRLQLDLEEAWLSDSELTSLFVLRPDIWELGRVSSPMLRLRGDTVWISGTIDPDNLPEDLPGVDRIRRAQPDTVRVILSGTIGQFAGADVIVNVTAAEVADAPFPVQFASQVAERLGLPHYEGAPETALVLPLPRGVNGVRVTESSLVLSP
jgi:hypothetical protein